MTAGEAPVAVVDDVMHLDPPAALAADQVAGATELFILGAVAFA